MDRPETIELVGQTLRWSEEQHLYESTVPKARPRLVAWPYLGEDGWVCTARLGGEVRIDLGAPTLPALDLALRAALAEVADAVAAWLPEREARVRAEERERIATERSGQLMPTVDAIRAEERERCAVVARKRAAAERAYGLDARSETRRQRHGYAEIRLSEAADEIDALTPAVRT